MENLRPRLYGEALTQVNKYISYHTGCYRSWNLAHPPAKNRIDQRTDLEIQPYLSTNPDCCCWLHFVICILSVTSLSGPLFLKLQLETTHLAGKAVALVGCLTIAYHDIHSKVSTEERALLFRTLSPCEPVSPKTCGVSYLGAVSAGCASTIEVFRAWSSFLCKPSRGL